MKQAAWDSEHQACGQQPCAAIWRLCRSAGWPASPKVVSQQRVQRLAVVGNVAIVQLWVRGFKAGM